MPNFVRANSKKSYKFIHFMIVKIFVWSNVWEYDDKLHEN